VVVGDINVPTRSDQVIPPSEEARKTPVGVAIRIRPSARFTKDAVFPPAVSICARRSSGVVIGTSEAIEQQTCRRRIAPLDGGMHVRHIIRLIRNRSFAGTGFASAAEGSRVARV
jgi:hypothetical protein